MRTAAVAVLMLVLALPAQGAEPRRASLTLASLTPLIVTGMNFGTREPVLLTYTAMDVTRTVGVRAKRAGSFRAKFDLALDRCSSFTVRAAGVHGTRAVLQVEPACEKKRKSPPKRAPAIPPKPPTN